MRTYVVFPELIAQGEKPQPDGQPDESRLKLPTPNYSYGWMLPRPEVFHYMKKVLGSTILVRHCNVDCLFQVRHLFKRWDEMGFKAKFAKRPLNYPQTFAIGDYYILIIIACNESTSNVDEAHGDKEYIDACRECIGDLESVKIEPVWFRQGLKCPPEGYTQYEVDPDLYGF